MKKVRVLLLCIMAVMLMACLAGCSSRRDNDTNQNTSAAGSTTAGESGSGTAAQGTESTRQDGTEDSTNNYTLLTTMLICRQAGRHYLF